MRTLNSLDSGPYDSFNPAVFLTRRIMTLVAVLTLVFVASVEAKIPTKPNRGPRDILLIAGGDVAYPRGWMDRLVERQKETMYRYVKGYVAASDLAFVNLESPYTNAPFTVKKKWPIATPPHRLDYVLKAGFNLFSLANNHMGDTGKRGIRDTLNLLAAKRKHYGNRLWWTGAANTVAESRKPRIFKVPGKRLTVAFHAFGYAGTSLVPTPGRRAVEQVRKYVGKADLTIVSVHMGREYRHVPSRGKAGLYRRFIDAGADIVLGHHPHVIQGVEAYKNGIIFHSLGNFSFASKTRRHHKTGAKLYGMLPLIYIKNARVERAEILPLYCNNSENWKLGTKTLRYTNFSPKIIREPVFAQNVLNELRTWTRDLPGVHERAKRAFTIRGGRAVIQVRRRKGR